MNDTELATMLIMKHLLSSNGNTKIWRNFAELANNL